jgi:hypothetical protein
VAESILEDVLRIQKTHYCQGQVLLVIDLNKKLKIVHAKLLVEVYFQFVLLTACIFSDDASEYCHQGKNS